MQWLLWFCGSLSIALAVLAHFLGIDHTPDWGTSRWIMLWIGIFFLLAGCLIIWKKTIFHWRDTSLGAHEYQQIIERIKRPILIRHVSSLKVVLWFSRPGISPVRWMAAVIVVAGSLTAWWLITAGMMTDFSRTTFYFDRLAEGFRHGQLSLLEVPDPRLSALSNPFDYRERGDIPVVWDASLYQGKYFLYWGPVPALLICMAKWFTPLPIGDLSLTLFFVIGIMAAQAWLIAAVYRRWFAHLPAGLSVAPLLAGTFCAPLLWLLARPSVYEAAISGGQFFWLLGLVFLFKGSESGRSKIPFFVAAGLTWAAAIGCRANLAVQIAAALACLLVVFFKQSSMRIGLVSGGIAFTLGMALLGWYNLARFNSVLETGYSYQLTGPAVVSQVDGELYAASYLAPNLYNTFLRPPQFDNEFPFIHSPWVTEAMWPFFIRIPSQYYYSEPVSGLLFICPFLFFLPAVFLKRSQPPEVMGLMIVSLASILVSLAFITTFMRYLLDFTPLLILLAAIGFWLINEKPYFLWRSSGLVLGIISAIFGISLAIAGPNNNLLNNNPSVFQFMAGLFGG
jgi:hypothetical protein